MLAAESARVHHFAGNDELALERVEFALEIAEAQVLPEVLSQALNTKGLLFRQRPHEARALIREALDIALGHVRRLIGPADDPVAGLKHRDEILQIMFWLHGEGLGPDVAVPDIMRFVDDEGAVLGALGHLVEDGYLEVVGEPDAPARYRLTATGIHEGRRRFMDEFEPYLARRGHGQCGSADCDCHQGGECQNAR